MALSCSVTYPYDERGHKDPVRPHVLVIDEINRSHRASMRRLQIDGISDNDIFWMLPSEA